MPALFHYWGSEVQRGERTCPNSRGKFVAELGLNPRALWDSQFHMNLISNTSCVEEDSGAAPGLRGKEVCAAVSHDICHGAGCWGTNNTGL